MNASLQCRRCASAAVRLWRSLRFLFRSAARCNISSCCCRRHLRRSSAALFSFCWFKRRAPFLICLRRQSRCRLWRAAVFRSSAAAFARRCAARCWFLSAACTASAASRPSWSRAAFRARRCHLQNERFRPSFRVDFVWTGGGGAPFLAVSKSITVHLSPTTPPNSSCSVKIVTYLVAKFEIPYTLRSKRFLL